MNDDVAYYKTPQIQLVSAPLTFVGEKNRKVTAVYPANDSQSCTCKLNLGLFF